jgi:hypothetical protein
VVICRETAQTAAGSCGDPSGELETRVLLDFVLGRALRTLGGPFIRMRAKDRGTGSLLPVRREDE